jgi:hypothetical protein
LAGLPKDQKRLVQGSNSELAPIPPFSSKDRHENNCESSSLPDDPRKIPCATEQGINSSRTGNRFSLNRELIRRIRESVTKVPKLDSRRMPFPSRIKKLWTKGVAEQQSPQIMSGCALHITVTLLRDHAPNRCGFKESMV